MNISNLNNYTNSIASQQNRLEQTEKKVKNIEEQGRLLEACQEFESIFTNIMLKSMRRTVPKSSLIEESTGREMFEEMYDEKLTREISKGSNGMGIAKMLYDQMKNRI
ncbi:rod-binding protein [Clostridium sp. D2Q-14]|uniref:rod-binding protein n=1 Tax=Anaeromonas gelatinilytica TaxID=2683194 RepID=UPI00193B2AF1|nr:rod-binding protein [Anaeromonas gelatinilytica]MBS4536424.1 rod-binding protein [Anaeromonas gelatinilytica]